MEIVSVLTGRSCRTVRREVAEVLMVDRVMLDVVVELPQVRVVWSLPGTCELISLAKFQVNRSSTSGEWRCKCPG
jgi:hypothetical protein